MNRKIINMKTIGLMVGAVLLAAGCASTPARTEPEVRLSAENPSHISPASSPGRQDLFRAGVAADVPEDSVLVGYAVTVETQEGDEIYHFGTETDPETLEEFDADATAAVPDTIRWNGRDKNNQFVDDGTYILSVSVTDNRGETMVSEPVSVVVKNTSPAAEVDVVYNVFSPDSDGERDALPLRQYGSAADEWTGRIVDEDETDVIVWNWSHELPEDHRWDGTDGTGDTVEDGTYEYILQGSDEAGNRVTVRKENLKVDTEQPSVSLERNRATFSPNDDGVQDTVTFTPEVPDSSELLEWEFIVTDDNENTFLERSGTEEVPGEFTFTGRSDDGVFPEGSYHPRLSVTFRNGETDSAETRPVTLDVTAPKVATETEQEQFSPEGSSENQEMVFTHEIDGAAELEAAIVPAGEDDPVLTEKWDDEIPESFSWNGQTRRGEVASTGRYRYVLTATDRGGNRSSQESEPFLLDRDAPSISVDVEPTPFYPGADVDSSMLTVSIETESRSEIAETRIVVYDPEGNEFVHLESDNVGDERITWDGRNEEGDLPQSARDYTLSVTVIDEVGNKGTTEKTVPVGILVEEDQGGDLRFRITGIHFPPFEADFADLNDPDMVEENRETLDEIAELLKDYPDQDVVVEGHAVHIYYEGPRKETEQDEVLLPLSEARAEAIIDALTDRGVDEDRLTAAGRGGSEPLVPHDDLENRWKNRRVEFELNS
jgi:outer membrane protein OmpA-like peptidoglycan-associated protein